MASLHIDDIPAAIKAVKQQLRQALLTINKSFKPLKRISASKSWRSAVIWPKAKSGPTTHADDIIDGKVTEEQKRK